MSVSITEQEFNLPGLTLKGLRAHSESPNEPRHKLLAAHGWLDNANSFIPLMPLLDNVDLIAVDLPGHGHSSHLPEGANYHFVDTPGTLLKVAESLGWETFHWLGHSLGGCLAPFAAVTAPNALKSIMMLEATGPLTEIATKLPDRLQRSGKEQRDATRFNSRLLSSIDDAIDSRLRAAKMTRSAAQLLVERQIKPVDGGFHWRFDPRHRMASPVYLTEPQVLSVLERVLCPALVVAAEEGHLTGRVDTENRLQHLQSLTQVSVPGHHHMHMDDPAPTARAINQFLSNFN
ncbi:MAG: alpha/beta hydrolase [Granulosicoccus sp.]|nr:alpha/beta hydrolase [Granulosicoccus sp.]